jgi:hypothetical protein
MAGPSKLTPEESLIDLMVNTSPSPRKHLKTDISEELKRRPNCMKTGFIVKLPINNPHYPVKY